MDTPLLPKESDSIPKTYEERNFRLGIPGFFYADLFSPLGLERLYEEFTKQLESANTALAKRYSKYCSHGEEIKIEESNLLIELSGYVSRFVQRLFEIESEAEQLKSNYEATASLFRFRDAIVKKIILKRVDGIDSNELGRISDALLEASWGVVNRCTEIIPQAEKGCSSESENALAQITLAIFDRCNEVRACRRAKQLLPESLSRWITVSRTTFADLSTEVQDRIKENEDPEQAWLDWLLEELVEAGRNIYLSQLRLPKHERWSSFWLPEKISNENLVEHEPGEHGGIVGLQTTLRRRDGFKLTDARMSREHVLGHVDYCLLCHSREKDSCSHGLIEKKSGGYKTTAAGVLITGCPLDEKISEAHSCAKKGDPIGALAIVMVDNPMCPGTGHRICNDCMRGCVYQKQDPVNVPEIETRMLHDVVYGLSFGVEIYGLLTRWNPLNRKRPYLLPYNGKNVLIVGQGPAGYTLAHYLTQEGFGVVGIDGLKIEPLPEFMTGSDLGIPAPIRNFTNYYRECDVRLQVGFGGVSEYGITVRWDKNFLSVLYLSLARRSTYRLYGGVRFGGTLTIEDAWSLGFNHIAIAAGAGKPTIIPMKNNLINGIRKASDFLMALQLSGAAKADSLSALQIRMPAIVIGGGLTGVDTATEMAAYYPLMVEKVLTRYEQLEYENTEGALLESLRASGRVVLQEFLEHGRMVRSERTRARLAGEKPNFVDLIRKWGGVTLVYRKGLKDAPAYRLNHEEVQKALEEGIEILEGYSPIEAIADDENGIEGLIVERQIRDDENRWRASGDRKTLPVRSLCVAAGTSPNTMYAHEQPSQLDIDDKTGFFVGHEAIAESGLVQLRRGTGFFTSYSNGEKAISYYGDNHPQYAGNVVRAMASAKHGYPKVVDIFRNEISSLDPQALSQRLSQWESMVGELDKGLLVTVREVKRLTPTVVEVVFNAPFAAKKFQPGQFFRVARYESLAPVLEGVRLATEGMALTGAQVDVERGLLSVIVLEMGHSSRLCANLRPGEPVVCMGPTGEPTTIPENETVLLLGGGLGNAVLLSVAQACKKKNNRVVYFAGYRHSSDIFKLDLLREYSDVLVVCCDHGQPPPPLRSQDRIFVGNIVQAMEAYGRSNLGVPVVSLSEVDRLLVIGSDRMMAAVKKARFEQLKDILREDHIAIASINSPMQCMMKEICAQCLQRHVDPKTGEESFVFSCVNQDQSLDSVDFDHLHARLQANHVLERLHDTWLQSAFARHPHLNKLGESNQN